MLLLFSDGINRLLVVIFSVRFNTTQSPINKFGVEVHFNSKLPIRATMKLKCTFQVRNQSISLKMDPFITQLVKTNHFKLILHMNLILYR